MTHLCVNLNETPFSDEYFAARAKRMSHRSFKLRTPIAGWILLLAFAATSWSAPPIELGFVIPSGGFSSELGQSPTRNGSEVAMIGDFDGDGLDDATTAAPNGIGVLEILYGRRISRDRIFIYGGTFVDFGRSHAGAGDVNGDGLEDLIIGEPRYIGLNPESGKAYVIFGGQYTQSFSAHETGNAVPGFIIQGEANSDQAGYAVAGIGDMNADGLDDVLVTAILAGDVPTEADFGRAYVIYGKSDWGTVMLADVFAGIGGFAITGEERGQIFGQSAAHAGDVNGDGIPDLVISAPQADPNGTDSGRCYIIFGRTSGGNVDLAQIAGGEGGFIIDGEQANDIAGLAVAGVGDVNGDGLSDFSFTLRQPLMIARTYIAFGKRDTQRIVPSQLLPSGEGIEILHEPEWQYPGFGARAAGDGNGDGLADLVVGAPFADSIRGAGAGRAYIALVEPGVFTVSLSRATSGERGYMMFGSAAGDLAGIAVGGAGDLNGDGSPDVVVGATGVQGQFGDNGGRAYCVFSPEPFSSTSATYRAFIRPGDGPGEQISPRARFRDARVTIDYSDDDFANNGEGGASLQSVAIIRTKTGIAGFDSQANLANVAWRLLTDRTHWEWADVTFKYTNAEIANLPEASLRVYRSAQLTGPWTELPTVPNPTRNELRARTDRSGYYAIALAGSAVNAAPFGNRIEY